MLVLLAHREARNPKVVRDVVDDEHNEAPISQEGGREGDVDENGRGRGGTLDDRRPVPEPGE